ncbi:MAG: ABC transporter substrate-binding protein, partial [Methanocorpusculum sp.]|nr:ABC transporter substrate-binding protein [Methanocorpusculum sp.]
KLNAGVAHFKASQDYNKLKEEYSMPYVKDTYIVGIDDYNSPWTYRDDDGKLTGLDYDSLMWIADKYGFDVEFKVVDWSKNINEIISGDIDMWFSGMTVTEERSNRITFSDPYLAGGLAVLCKAGDTVSKEDYESGKAVIGVLLGTSNEEWIKSHFRSRYNSMLADGKIVLVSDQGKMFKMLANGDLDCVTIDEFGYKNVVKEENLALVAIFPGGGDFGVAMKNGNIGLLDIINSGFADMKSAGVYDELLEKYDLL